MFNQLFTTIRKQIPWTDELEIIDVDQDDDDLISSIKSEVQEELDLNLNLNLNSGMRNNSLSDGVYFNEGFNRGDIFTLRFDPAEDPAPSRSYVILSIDNHMSYRKGMVQEIHFIPIGVGVNKRPDVFINLDEMTLCQYDSGRIIKKISAIEIIGKMYECGIPDLINKT